ncbi:MAG: ASKHA domain-containing protein [Candidatus Aminicenantes bacterium]
MSVILKTYDRKIEVKESRDKTVMELARSKGIFITSSCGEQGQCGRCLVHLIQGEFWVNNKKIKAAKDHPRKALACQTRVKSRGAVVEIPQSSLVEMSGKIVVDFTVKDKKIDPPTKKFCLSVPQAVLENQEPDRSRLVKVISKQTSAKDVHISLQVLRKLPFALEKGKQKVTVTLSRMNEQWSVVNIEPGDTTQRIYGLAVDVGTTTVVGGLVDVTKGELTGKVSLFNQQIKVAEDVISRLSSIKSPKELDLLRTLVIQNTINPIIRHLCKNLDIRKEEISRAAVSGNTIMMHLLLGLSPKSIGEVPFQPVDSSPGPFSAQEVGLEISPDGIVDIMPSVSGYIGGDVTSDIYVSKLHQEKDFAVLIDIGTNGEIVTCDSGDIKACSTAAGPAFEGYGLYHGCRAALGAVEQVAFDEKDNIRIKVIGGGKASGICGTGVIDILSEGLRIGLINQMGRFDEERLKELRLNWKVKQNGRVIKACVIAGNERSALNEPVVITESDISKILQAKAAVYAALKILLEIQGKSWRDIKKLVIAGGFGRHIHLKNAISMGLLPPVPEDRVEMIGNGSLGGAFLSLIESDVVGEMNEILSRVEVIELNMQKDFQQHYIDALFLPNRNKK